MKPITTTLLITLFFTHCCIAQYISSDNLQSFNPTVSPCNTNQEIHRIEIEIGSVPVTLTNLTFTTNGSSGPIPDISSLRLYYYNDSTTFDISQAILLGVCPNPWSTNIGFLTGTSGGFGFNGMVPGKNYFWLTVDISCSAVPGNVIKVCFTDGMASGTGTFTPTSFCSGPGTVIVNPTGIIENSNLDLVSIYPMPSNGDISVAFNAEINLPVSIELLDITGKKLDDLFSGIPESKVLNFSLQHYHRGVYLMRLEREGKVVLSKIAVL